jgi:arginine decarboxylase
MDVIDQLREAGMLHNLELLHYHLGSQIADIRSIREGAREACRYYVDLVREGAALTYLDLGGGLGVDYDGSRSAGEQSRNYSLAEYCGGVVEAIQESLAGEEIPHPTIVTESGRATAAYSSVLLFNILGVGHFEPRPVAESVADDSDERVAALWQVLQEVTANNAQQSHNNAGYYFDTLVDAFKRGEASLRQRAAGENLYLAILQSIVRLLPEMQRVPVELEGLQQRLSDIYYGNFSVFQSLPDSWAIQQLFPVMPIHRLQEEPTRLGMIADLTCDCDGKLSRFVTGDGEQGTLALHPLNSGEDYHLGVFLTGAYQETLGDLHNLFGDTNVASVRIKEDGALEFVHELHGDSIADVLGYVEYNTTELYQRFRATAEAAVVDKKISVQQRQRMLSAFTDSLRGYTYFEN